MERVSTTEIVDIIETAVAITREAGAGSRRRVSEMLTDLSTRLIRYGAQTTTLSVISYQSDEMREKIRTTPGVTSVMPDEIGYAVAAEEDGSYALAQLKAKFPQLHIYINGVNCGPSPYGLMDR